MRIGRFAFPGSTLANAGFVCRREIVRDGLGNVAGSRPFDSALQGGDEADITSRKNCGVVFGADMAEGGLKDASFTVGNGEEHRFVMGRSVL